MGIGRTVMSEPLSLVQCSNARFRTTRSADELNQKFLTKLGVKYRYAPARLAISRSLADVSQPPDTNAEESGKIINGADLFGEELPTWVALVTQHKGAPVSDVKELVSIVANHWHRGIQMLWDDWHK